MSLDFRPIADPPTPAEGEAEIVSAEVGGAPVTFIRYAPHEETPHGTVLSRGEIRVLIGHGAVKGQPVYLVAGYVVDHLNGSASRSFAFRRAEERAAVAFVDAWERLQRTAAGAAEKAANEASS